MSGTPAISELRSLVAFLGQDRARGAVSVAVLAADEMSGPEDALLAAGVLCMWAEEAGKDEASAARRASLH